MEEIELYVKLSSGYQIKTPLSQRPKIKTKMCMFNIWNKNKSISDVVLEEKIGQKAQPPLK